MGRHQCAFGIILKLFLELTSLLVLLNGEGIPVEIHYHVTAVEGGKAELPCDLTVPHSKSKVSLVLWYKDGAGLPLFSLDLRDKAIAQSNHSRHPNIESRISFTHRKHPGFLLLEPVKTDDAGVFRCRVDFYKAPTRNQRVRLSVTEPTRYVQIVDKSGEEVKDVITYKEGEDAYLVCQTDSGNPLPAITWWKGSSLLAGTYDITPDGTIKNELQILSLSRQDLGATLTCQASNNNITLPATKVVTLDLNLRPMSVQIIPPSDPLSANKAQQIRCQSYGSRPAPLMSWFKGSKRLKSSKDFISDDRNVTTSILTFEPTVDDNGKFLTCRADNRALFGSTLEDGWRMDIHYPPTAVLQLGSSLRQENLKEGDDVYFDCYITANPRIYKVDWKFQGTYLNHNVSAGIIISNQTLVLQKIKRSNMGAYSCIARNTEGDGESNEILLKIKYAPYCKPGQKSLYGIAKQDTSPIFCDLVAHPSTVHFKWSFNNTNENLDVATGSFTSSGLRSILSYRPITEKDYGLLYCWGINDVGEQREPCVFNIIAAGPPDPVTNCSIQNETENAVHIECTAGFDGGLEQRFGIEVFEAMSHEMKFNTTNNISEFTVHGLDPGKGFLVSVYSVNAKGRSAAMTLVANTLRVAERRTGIPTIFTITPVLGVLIGIVAALVLVAVAIVVVMRLRNSEEEKKKKEGEAEAVDRATTPLKKEIDEMESVEEKNPDIVPTEDDHLYDDVHEKAVQKLNNTNERIYENVPNFNAVHREYENLNNARNQANRLKQNEDVLYAELQLPNNQRAVPVTTRRTTEPTVYAQIDHNRKAPPINSDYEEDFPHTVETPLMTNHRESTV